MLKKLSLFLILCFAVSQASAMAQPPSPLLQAWIRSLMRQYHIPGVSIAVIRNYQIEWAKGFGLRDKANQLPITTDTLFQAASISKPLTATAALISFAHKGISIDADINQTLVSWQIPENPYTKAQPVTLRLLLSHSAGVSGFRETGYPTNTRFPTVAEMLRGVSPANTPPIQVIRKPNTQFEYSPASYTIVQAVLVDIYQQPFDRIMQDLILTPLNMQHSTFREPLPRSYYANMAWPYLPDGHIPPHSPYAFPEANGGLWSTPTDLAKFVIAIQKALAGLTQGAITPQIAREMMQPGVSPNMGMGFEINVNQYGEITPQGGSYFRHGGFQTGFLSMLVGSKRQGFGIVIMYNSAPYMTAKNVPQYDFLAKVIKRIAQVEQWPAYAQSE